MLGFHAELPGFRGGFAGVDIFFVISGYLIGGQIMDDLRAGTFSFARFYSRRVVRIVPPLLLVVGAGIIAALVVPMLPTEMERIGTSGAASSAMVANWYFMNRHGYFDPMETEPFLHLWSLGVEEQFYLVAPLALVATSLGALRYHKSTRSAWLAVTLLGFVFSLTLALLFTRSKPQFGFYATPARMWELLAGGLAAWLVRTDFRLSPGAVRWTSGTGLALIVAGLAADRSRRVVSSGASDPAGCGHGTGARRRRVSRWWSGAARAGVRAAGRDWLDLLRLVSVALAGR